MSELSIRHCAVGAAVAKGMEGYRRAHKENNAEFSSADLVTMQNLLQQRQPGKSPLAARLISSHLDALRKHGGSHGR